MKFEVRLFATLKDRAGRDRIQIDVEQPATVQDLILAAVRAYPALAEALPSSLIAVNKAYAGPTTVLQSGDEVAIFPPVSGGASSAAGVDFPHPTFFAVTAEAVDLSMIHSYLTRPDIGAIVTFTGSVRGETQREGLPPATIYLQYEAYQEMAELKMGQIAQEIWARWPVVKGVAIVQRIGKLAVGETTTIVACAAGHRDQGAFEAARYGIDRLKEIVPIWKKEVDQDKSVWIEGDYRPTEEDNSPKLPGPE
jgi:molybdopterin synthase catalytic subunit